MQTRPLGRLRDLRWETYIWLIYSLPYLFATILGNLALGERVLLLLAYVAFLALYTLGYLLRDARVLLVVAGLDVLAILCSIRNPGAMSFYIFASAVIANGFAPKTAVKILAGQVLVGAAAGAFLATPGSASRFAR